MALTTAELNEWCDFLEQHPELQASGELIVTDGRMCCLEAFSLFVARCGELNATMKGGVIMSNENELSSDNSQSSGNRKLHQLLPIARQFLWDGTEELKTTTIESSDYKSAFCCNAALKAYYAKLTSWDEYNKLESAIHHAIRGESTLFIYLHSIGVIYYADFPRTAKDMKFIPYRDAFYDQLQSKWEKENV